jgi:acetyl esterase/lipase
MPIEPFPGMDLTDEMRAAVTIEERFAPGPAGEPDVRVLLYRPHATGTLPLVMSFHGGAFAMRAENFPSFDARIAMLGALVVSVDYRIVPEHPFPCGIEDCYAATGWAVDTLDIDPGRVVLTGASAGGALVAGVTMMARDRNGPPIAFQALVIPVLDDRMETPSMRAFAEGHTGFNRMAAEGMWAQYLGDNRDGASTSPYAAPARAGDLSGLPPAFIQVNGLDPLRDEGILYAMRLMEAGVAVELYCAPGAYHGDVPVDPRPSIAAQKLFSAAMAAAVA